MLNTEQGSAKTSLPGKKIQNQLDVLFSIAEDIKEAVMAFSLQERKGVGHSDVGQYMTENKNIYIF